MTSMLALRIASLITSLPVKNEVVRGASFIMNAVSVNTWPFLFLVPMTDVVSIDLVSFIHPYWLERRPMASYTDRFALTRCFSGDPFPTDVPKDRHAPDFLVDGTHPRRFGRTAVVI